MCVLGVEGSENKCGPPPRILAGTTLNTRYVSSVMCQTQGVVGDGRWLIMVRPQ